ncbi:MAG TPA: hypothetical protein VLT91_12000 [Rhizomicrobium sp.]|nr:hypothetical protein [Rhizomicrobium sp.]
MLKLTKSLKLAGLLTLALGAAVPAMTSAASAEPYQRIERMAQNDHRGFEQRGYEHRGFENRDGQRGFEHRGEHRMFFHHGWRQGCRHGHRHWHRR